ncbi:MAG TPA: DNA-formamidopyrimidine glycosylase [bacterium]|nr:DNA-formamidopyrimidine glycosylase [bacterium]
MPELPEVQTIVNDLNDVLLNKKIVQLKVIDSKLALLKKSSTRERIINQKVINISRRAKNIIFLLANNYRLAVHLKMTGQLIWSKNKQWLAGGHPTKDLAENQQSWPNKSTRLILNFSNSSQLFFNDTRKFGWVKLMSPEEWQDYQQRLGVEPLTSLFTSKFLADLFKRHPRSKIKTLLLNQQYLVGLGNIYVDESLFAAKILPTRLAHSLKPQEIKALQENIKKILHLAITKRGTSFSDYRDGRGKIGNFSKLLKVYGRSGKPCPICQQPIRKIKLNGRGTHFCPICQK